MRVVRGIGLGVLIILQGLLLEVWGQSSILQELDAMDLPDTATIDQLNDYVWSIAGKEPDTALVLAQEAITRSEAADHYKKGLINGHTLLGILYKDRGFYEISVEHYLKALQIAEAEADQLRISGCLNNLGAVCQKQKNYAKALSYFQRSVSIEEEYGTDEGQRSIRLYNIGETYEKMDSLDEAYAYYYNSLLIEEAIKNEEGVFYARLGIGKVDARNGNFTKSELELSQALSLGKELGNQPGICEVHLAFGNLYLSQNQLKPAFQGFQTALEIAQPLGYKSLEMEAMRGLSQVLRKQGEYLQSMEYLEGYYALSEQLNSAEVNSRIGELQAKYELKKKEQEIELLKQKDLVRSSQAEYDHKLRNYLIFTIFFVILLVLINIWRNRKIR